MLRIPWTDHETNNNVLNRAGTERHLLKKIRKRQAEFLGHVIRKSKLQNLIMTGKFDKSQKDQESATSLA